MTVGGRPLVDYLIARMRAGGCEEIRIVTRPDKSDVIEHARSQDLKVVQATPESVSESLLTGLTGLARARRVVLGFPDTIWQPEDGFNRLLDELADGWDVVLGCFWWDEPERGDTVTIGSDARVSRVDVKPARPTSNLIWGCAAARAGALDVLHASPEPGLGFDALSRQGRVGGAVLSRDYVDLGTPRALEAYVERIAR